jgi:hypothetical protein
MVAIPLGYFGVKGQLNSKFTAPNGALITRDQYIDRVNQHLSEASPVTVADEYYYTALNDYNKYVRLTKTVYGDNPEAQKYIAQLGEEIQKAEQNRRSNRKKLAIIIAIIAVIVILPLFIRPSVQTYFNDVISPDFSIFDNTQPNK